MSNNNYCKYRQGKLCVGPDGKAKTCSVDLDSIYGPYEKQNAVRMCGRNQKWNNAKKLETKVQ